MKSKKVISGLLSLVMVATSVFTGDMTAVKAAEMPEVLAYFSFDEDATTGTNATATVSGEGAAIVTDDVAEGKGALSLGSSSFLTVTNAEGKNPITGKDAITISYLSKPSPSASGNKGWVYHMSKDAKNSYPNEHYVAVMDVVGSLSSERWNNAGSRLPSIGYKHSENDWKLVTMVYGESTTDMYINGVLVATLADEPKLTTILGDTSVLQVGKANWESGEYYAGLLDEFTIYDGTMTAEQVNALYVDWTTPDAPEVPTPVAAYDFNDETLNSAEGTAETVAVPKGAGFTEYTGEITFEEGRTGESTDKALSFNSYGVNLPQRNIGSDFSVSFWYKPTANYNNFQPVMQMGSCGADNANWISLAGAWESAESDDAKESFILWDAKDLAAADELHFDMTKNEWNFITLTHTGNAYSVYVDGTLIGTTKAVSYDILSGEDAGLCFGVNNFADDGIAPGSVDEIKVFDSVLTATQIRYLYDGKTAVDIFDEEGFTATAEVSMLVGESRAISITLPSAVEGVKVAYTSADTSVAVVDKDGKVKGVNEGTTTVTTTVTLGAVVKTQTTNVTVNANENVKSGIAVEYDLTGAVDGMLKDLSGRGNDATIHNGDYISFGTEEDGTPYMEITDPAAYLDLPMNIMNSLTDKEAFTIETTYSRSANSQGDASWLFCFGSIPKSTGTNYMFYCPWFGFGGNEVRAGIKNSGTEKLFSTGLVNEDEKYYTVNMVFDHGTIKLYIDGVKVGGQLNSGYSIENDIVNGGTQNDILGYIGKSCWEQDTNFMGKFSSFKIYDKVLTDEDVQLSKPEYQKAFQKTLDESLAVEDILGSNESAEEVVYNLNLLATVNENEVVWTSSDEAVITANGTVHNGTEDKVVELKATMTSGALVAEKKFTVTVKAINKAELESLTAEVEALKSNVYVDESSKTTLTRLMASAAEATSQTEIDSLVSKIKKAMESVTYVESYADPFKSIDESKIAGSMEVAVGKTVNMYTIPESLKDMVKVAYASDDATVATVSDAGVITGVKAGYTRVTLTVTANSDGFAMEYQTLVKVTSDAVSTTTTAVSATAATTSLVKAGTTQIVVTAPANATISYRAKGAVSVNKDGKVTGKKGGNGTVYVVVEANGKKVVKKVAFTVADITGKSSVRVGKKLTLKVAGISGKVTWSVDKKKLATIKNGKLTAKKKGKVVVTAKVGNVTLKKTITIKKK